MHNNVLPDRELIAFLLFDWLKIDETELDRETFLSIFDMAQRLATEQFLPLYRKADIQEPWLDGANAAHILPEFHEALRQYAVLGLFGASFPESAGGMALPFAASAATTLLFAAALPSAYAYPMLTIANARLIRTFGTAAQQQQFAQPEIEGRWFGTMCLSEPQAGSSLGDIRTRAMHDGQDELGARFRLRGNKMWISGGDQDASDNIVHLVLAKVSRPDGSLPEDSKGISLFIVPKWLPDGAHNDVAVAGLNHKLGFRGTTNCLLNFGEEEGAVGWLVGNEGQGLAQMFMMMNEARISVGLGAAALAYRGYRHALQYATERTQGRAIGTRGGRPIPILSHVDVRRMLLQQKALAEGAIALGLFCAKLFDEKEESAEALLALLTPVAKSWPSEFGLIANDLAIQVHGGYGYTRDFDVEQIWRDNRLNPIHEGTTGIQAIDLLGRKLLAQQTPGLTILRERIAHTVYRADASADWSATAGTLRDFWTDADNVIHALRAREPKQAFDEATLFLRAFGHGVVAWLWLDQVLAVDAVADSSRRAGVEHACRYFFDVELPQAVTWLDIVRQGNTAARDIPDEAFA